LAQCSRGLDCEVEVIMAIAEQETEKLQALGLSAFDKQCRPTILFERHKFGKITNQKFSEDNPDMSGSKEYLPGSARDKSGKRFDDGNHYGLFSWQYKKLTKAYMLAPEASLAACSWGKFQIMGSNYKVCGFKDVTSFVESMCISEVEHLKAVVKFAINTGLRPALKEKKWASIAAGYNGPGYRRNNYDSQLESIYEKLVKRRKATSSNVGKNLK
jgi:N-acetylmuramidase